MAESSCRSSRSRRDAGSLSDSSASSVDHISSEFDSHRVLRSTKHRKQVISFRKQHTFPRQSAHIPSSTLSQKDLKKWFHPYMEAGIASEFTDVDENSLLASILKQVSVDEEYMKDQCQLEAIWKNEIPAVVKKKCETACRIMCPVLEKVQASAPMHHERFYDTLWTELHDLRLSQEDIANYDVVSKVIRSMFAVADLFVRPPIGDSAEIAHRAWCEVLREIFELVLGTRTSTGKVNQPTDTTKTNALKEAVLQYNDLSTFVLKLPDLNNSPHFATGRPDLLIEMQYLSKEAKTHSKMKDEILCVAEVKSQKCKGAFGSGEVQLDCGGSSSVTDSMDSSSTSANVDRGDSGVIESSKEKVKKPKNEIRNLKSQHFLQLLSCMAPLNPSPFERTKYPLMEASFGLYMNGFKIYPTSLNVVQVRCIKSEMHGIEGIEKPFKCADVFYAKKLLLGRSTGTPGAKMATTDGPMHLYMTYCKYLCIFNPLHFKTLLNYLQILVWHDGMHKSIE